MLAQNRNVRPLSSVDHLQRIVKEHEAAWECGTLNEHVCLHKMSSTNDAYVYNKRSI